MRTLPINIHVAPDCEFVLLNYGSKDGMHEWVRDNMRPWINRGTIKYYRTQLPEYFVATHAKNIAHRQATGDILCNLDADNFLIDGFVELVKKTMSDKQSIMTAPIFDMFNMSGSCGKIAVHREHFYSVNGYNEDINLGWGWDDIDFELRAAMHNKLKYAQTPVKFCRVIDHDESDRVKNFRTKNLKDSQRTNGELLETVKNTRNYVVNKNREWGVALDLSSDI